MNSTSSPEDGPELGPGTGLESDAEIPREPAAPPPLSQPPPRATQAPPAPPAALEIRSLRVDYGDFVAVDHLSLTVAPGEILGIVGPNGAGKTSTFRVLATLMEPTHGEVFFAGVDIAEDSHRARQLMGYMPDLAPVPSDLRVGEFLDFYADAHGLGGPAERRTRADECLAQVGLLPLRDRGCRELSRGQTQRVVLAKTLLHRPRVLILDEPASGLDPLARRELRIVLQALARTGVTILISSHILGELAEMCTSLCVLDRGRLVAHGGVDAVRRRLGRTGRRLTLGLLTPPAEATAWLADRPSVRDPITGVGTVSFEFDGDDAAQADLLEALVRDGLRVKSLEEHRSSLEDLLVGIAAPAPAPNP